MDVYIFDLEHLAAAQRGADTASPYSAEPEHYDLAELNRLVRRDLMRRADRS